MWPAVGSAPIGGRPTRDRLSLPDTEGRDEREQERADQADRQAARERLQNLAALRQAAYRDQQQRAKTMAAAGDFSEYPALGFSTSEVRYLQDMWRRMHPKLG